MLLLAPAYHGRDQFSSLPICRMQDHHKGPREKHPTSNFEPRSQFPQQLSAQSWCHRSRFEPNLITLMRHNRYYYLSFVFTWPRELWLLAEHPSLSYSAPMKDSNFADKFLRLIFFTALRLRDLDHNCHRAHETRVFGFVKITVWGGKPRGCRCIIRLSSEKLVDSCGMGMGGK